MCPFQSDEMSKGPFNTFAVLILESQMFMDQNSYGMRRQNETSRRLSNPFQLKINIYCFKLTDMFRSKTICLINSIFSNTTHLRTSPLEVFNQTKSASIEKKQKLQLLPKPIWTFYSCGILWKNLAADLVITQMDLFVLLIISINVTLCILISCRNLA